MTNLHEEKVAQAIEGDKDAFGDLYEIFLDEIYHYIFYRVERAEEAEDLTEIVFLRAWQALGHNPPREIPFRLWLYRIAHNAVIDHYRTRKNNLALDEAPPLAAPDDSLEYLVGQREQQAMIDRTMLQLKADHQQILTYRFFAGLSHREIALVMERDEQAVRALQYRAIKALRSLLVSQEGFHV